MTNFVVSRAEWLNKFLYGTWVVKKINFEYFSSLKKCLKKKKNFLRDFCKWSSHCCMFKMTSRSTTKRVSEWGGREKKKLFTKLIFKFMFSVALCLITFSVVFLLKFIFKNGFFSIVVVVVYAMMRLAFYIWI